MLFVKRSLPLILCFIVGILVTFQYYIPHQISVDFLEGVTNWVRIIAVFAMVLGLVSVLQIHIGKVRRRSEGWGFSLFLFAGLIIGLTTGIISHGKTLTETGIVTSFGWMYNYMLYPLGSTMFCLLGFYIVSASYRAFRIKSMEALVLVLAAAILIFARVPLGQFLWYKVFGGSLPFELHEIVEWIMNYPNMAAARGILIGVALGMIATAVKIIMGIERQYLGGKE